MQFLFKRKMEIYFQTWWYWPQLNSWTFSCSSNSSHAAGPWIYRAWPALLQYCANPNIAGSYWSPKSCKCEHQSPKNKNLYYYQVLCQKIRYCHLSQIIIADINGQQCSIGHQQLHKQFGNIRLNRTASNVQIFERQMVKHGKNGGGTITLQRI